MFPLKPGTIYEADEAARREFERMTSQRRAGTHQPMLAGAKRGQEGAESSRHAPPAGADGRAARSSAVASAPPSVASTASRLQIAQLREELASFRAMESALCVTIALAIWDAVLDLCKLNCFT